MISILIQVFMWIAVFTQFFLLAPDVYHIFKTRNTLDQKKWKFLVWIVCSLAWIIYAVLLSKSTPIDEVIGLAISEGINVLCILYIMLVKLMNIHRAKELHITEKEWYILYVKEKERRKRLRKLYGTSTPSEVADIKGDREELIKMIRRLWKNPKYTPIIDKNIIRSKVYRDRVAGEYKNPNARLQHFIDAATVAELASFYSLIVQDMAVRELTITVVNNKNNPKPVVETKPTSTIN